jgi:hypothetical protein
MPVVFQKLLRVILRTDECDISALSKSWGGVVMKHLKDLLGENLAVLYDTAGVDVLKIADNWDGTSTESV